MSRTARLNRRMPCKKNVEEECQLTVLSHPPKIRDLPQVAYFHGELKNEGVLGSFNWSLRRIRRWWQNLHPGAFSPPRTSYTKAAETNVTPYLIWPGSLDLLDNLSPLIGIERGSRLDGNNLLVIRETQLDLAGRAREWQIERIWITIASVILAGFSDAL